MIKKTIKVNYPFYKIIADGGMSASTIGEGRFIPALIIDNNNDKDVSELIQLHKGMPPGDTQLQWSLPKTFFAPKSIFLNIEFIKPMKINFGIEFDLLSQYSLVDGIIQSRAFYLMTGKTSDKVSQNIENSIIIEVPNMDFDKKWSEMLNDTLKKKFLNMGASKKDAQKLTLDHIKSMRDVWNFRRPEQNGSH